MAVKKNPNARLVCNYTSTSVSYTAQERDPANPEKWIDISTREYMITDRLALPYEDGDARVSLVAYGLRGLLADRTSQLREHGPAAVLEGMDSYYQMLVEGQWKATRKAAGRSSGPDMALVQVIADLKGVPLVAAMAAVNAATAEQVALLKAKYAEQYAAAQAQLTEGTDLGDLLA